MKKEMNRTQTIKKLLSWHPPSATTPFPKTERTPLCQAIANGASWHGMGYYYGYEREHVTCDGDATEANVGLIQLLWQYAPEKTFEVDCVTGLYPFMLAAATAKDHQTNNDVGAEGSYECLVVDTVYNLLRKDPQLVASALEKDMSSSA